MVQVNIIGMVIFIQDNGQIQLKMDMELNNFLMVIHILGIIILVNHKVKVNIDGIMVLYIQDSFMKEKEMVMENGKILMDLVMK